MAKLTMLSGLPASGKSTKAKEILTTSGNSVRINKDLLRTMLHFDKWTGTNESLTKIASSALASEFLRGGINVVIDDTNMGQSHLDSWKNVAKNMDAKFEHIHVDTPLIECLQRDGFRSVKAVGRSVITNMALQYGKIPKPDKGFILCDLDGTLCDITHRLHFVNNKEKKDWKNFFAGIAEDSLNLKVDLKLRDYRDAGHDIIFVSARPDNYRKQTEEWLDKNITFPYLSLIMRPANDKRPDTEAKKTILDKYFPDKSFIKVVIDDRPSVIRMWRENGLDVIDVGPGIDF